MKISKKLHQAIQDAVDKAARDVVAQYAPICTDVPPNGWQPEDTKVFDQAHEVAHRAKENIQALFA
jgi:hypothetical protein